MKRIISQYIDPKSKREIKVKYQKIKKSVVDSLLHYDGSDLQNKLKHLGVRSDDCLWVHSNFKPDSGFRGKPDDVVQAFMDLVGRDGNLLMVSIPFRGTAYDYLLKNKPFRLNKTLSMMGLITEVFRRKPGVLRSFHPTHPVLAYGKDSAQLVADHEKSLYPCGPDTPFGKLREMNGKILFYDVGFGAITFFHYVEHILRDKLPFPVYHEEIFSVAAYDRNDEEHQISTYAFNRKYVRNAGKLEAEMDRKKKLIRAKVGHSNLILANAEDVVACMTEMVENGNLPYDL